MKKTIVIIGGYFDPLHIGHLEYITEAKKLGDILLVVVNNNEQAKLKKGYCFMDDKDRLEIVKNIKDVDVAILSIDKDETINMSIHELFHKFARDYNLIFAKGGDRTQDNTPEVDTCERLGIKCVFGISRVLNSSRRLVENAKKMG